MQAFRSSPILLVTGRDATRARSDDAPELARRLTHIHPRVLRCQQAVGAQVFSEDDELGHVYVLARGWALKYKSLFDGRRQVLDFALPGDVLGFVGESHARHAVEMLTDGEVVSIPREIFGALAAANPELMLSVVHQLERATARAYEQMVSIGCRAALSRVSRLLIELAERQAPAGAALHDIDIAAPMKQLHIADALGLRGETVCRALKRLAAANLATFRQGRLQVPDLDALRRVAETPDAQERPVRAAPRRGAVASPQVAA